MSDLALTCASQKVKKFMSVLRTIVTVDWVKRYLIRNGSIWAVKEKLNRGSWMWGKILKYRAMAKQFCKVEVKNGESTSFWFDCWSSLGCLHETVGGRGCIDLGIPLASTVSDVLKMTRRRKHRQHILNQIEDEVRQRKLNPAAHMVDEVLWKGRNGVYRKKFVSKETWWQIRTAKPTLEGHKEIWFPYATPRFAFMTWLVVKNRVATGERMLNWNQNVNTCCVIPVETREHLFFSCSYSGKVWKELASGLLLDRYTAVWEEILELLTDANLDKITSFVVKYVFQNTIHPIWRERNDRRHGEQPNPTERLVKTIDKNVRNRLSTINDGGASNYEGSIQVWFASRP